MTHVRTLLESGSKIFLVLLAVALVYTLGGQAAEATHEPANKTSVAGAYDDTPVLATNGQRVLLLSETLKTSKPTDLILSATAECSIITNVITTGDQSASSARGQLRFYMEIVTDGVTRPVAVEQTSTGPNRSTDNDPGDVVFCDRTYTRSTSGFGLDDQSHKIETYMNTRSANAFNWFALNVGSGIHEVNLYAEYDGNGTTAGNTASGIVGTRTLVIQPTKAKNDENVHPTEIVVP